MVYYSQDLFASLIHPFTATAGARKNNDRCSMSYTILDLSKGKNRVTFASQVGKYPKIA